MEDNTIKELLINEQITDKEVRLLDSNGEQLGIVSLDEALEIADKRQLDLVNIAPQVTPPACKLMDYSRYRFEQLKREKDARKNQKTVKLREVQLSATIDVGDLNTKANACIKFLQHGDRVKVSILLKGRQQSRPENSQKVMADFYELVKDYASIESKPSHEGRFILMILAPINKK